MKNLVVIDAVFVKVTFVNDSDEQINRIGEELGAIVDNLRPEEAREYRIRFTYTRQDVYTELHVEAVQHKYGFMMKYKAELFASDGELLLRIELPKCNSFDDVWQSIAHYVRLPFNDSPDESIPF